MCHVDDILSELGVDSRGVPLYANPLNLVWSPEGAEHDLLSFRRVAALLFENQPLWSSAILLPYVGDVHIASTLSTHDKF